MDFAAYVLDEFQSIDATTFRLLGLLTAISCWIVKGNLKQPVMAVFLWPVIFLAAAGAYYFTRDLELFSSLHVEQWLFMILIAQGVATTAIVFLMVVWTKLMDYRKVGPSPGDGILYEDA